jgi:hypothetical protein
MLQRTLAKPTANDFLLPMRQLPRPSADRTRYQTANAPAFESGDPTPHTTRIDTEKVCNLLARVSFSDPCYRENTATFEFKR